MSTAPAEVAFRVKRFDEMGAAAAGIAFWALVAAILLIAVGLYFYMRYKITALLVILVLGIIAFLVFVFYAFRHRSLVACLKDNFAEGCIERLCTTC